MKVFLRYLTSIYSVFDLMYQCIILYSTCRVRDQEMRAGGPAHSARICTGSPRARNQVVEVVEEEKMFVSSLRFFLFNKIFAEQNGEPLENGVEVKDWPFRCVCHVCLSQKKLSKGHHYV